VPGDLVAIRNKAHWENQRVLLVDASNCVSRILELTFLTDAFQLSRTMHNTKD
jgi:hypothetical protein